MQVFSLSFSPTWSFVFLPECSRFPCCACSSGGVVAECRNNTQRVQLIRSEGSTALIRSEEVDRLAMCKMVNESRFKVARAQNAPGFASSSKRNLVNLANSTTKPSLFLAIRNYSLSQEQPQSHLPLLVTSRQQLYQIVSTL